MKSFSYSALNMLALCLALAGLCGWGINNPSGDIQPLGGGGTGTDPNAVHVTGNETVMGIKTFTSAPVVPLASFPESATANLVSDLSSKATDSLTCHLAGVETLTGVKTFSLAPIVPSASFPENAVTNLTTDLAAKATDSLTCHLAGAENITGVKTFTAAPVVPSASFPESAITSLTSDLAAKATDSLTCHLAGAENITGVKTFTAAPVVPSASFPESAITSLASDLAAKATDSLTCHLAGTETFTGSKTFSTNLTANQNVVVAGDLQVAAGSQIVFSGRSKFMTAADGYFQLLNNAGAGFTGLRFGGTSSAFPMMKVSGTGFAARLADDTADTSLTVGAFTANGNVTVGQNANNYLTWNGNSRLLSLSDGTLQLTKSDGTSANLWIGQTTGSNVGVKIDATTTPGSIGFISSNTGNATLKGGLIRGDALQSFSFVETYNGTVAQVAYGNTASGNSGLYFPTNTTPAIAANGAQAMMWDTNQNVIVGNPNGGNWLQVGAGAADGAGDIYLGTQGNANGLRLHKYGAGSSLSVQAGNGVGLSPIYGSGYYVGGASILGVSNTGTFLNLLSTTGVQIQTAAVIRSGALTPNANVTGSIGDIYLWTGGSTGTTLWLKESGTATNTGWSASTSSFMCTTTASANVTYTSTTLKSGCTVFFTGSTAAQTLTLPAVAIGQNYWIVNRSSVTVSVVTPTGSILGFSLTGGTRTIPAGGSMQIVHDGTDFSILGSNGTLG